MEWCVEMSDVLLTRTRPMGTQFSHCTQALLFLFCFFIYFKVKLKNSKEKAEDITNHWPSQVSSASRFWFPSLHDIV